MQKELINRYYNKLFLGAACLLCIYLIARACCVDITDDEAWSFYNVKHFWYVEALCSGNTHWLNFLAIKISLLFGFEQVGQIRWFSVLSGIGFILVVYQWTKTLGHLSLRLFAFSIVLLHPYLLEYLTLARGYSAGLCFMALSLLLLVRTNEKRTHAIYALLFAGLSAIANFNFFYYFSAFCLLYFYRFYFRNGFTFFKSKWFYAELIYVSGITALVLRALLFIRECSNDIADFGGEKLIPSVFKSYLKLLCYGNVAASETTLTVCAYVFFCIILMSSLFGILKFKQHNNRVFQSASVLLLTMLGLTVLTKWCFGTLYPTDRTALMFYPLMAIVVVEFVRAAINSYSVIPVFLILSGAALFINFLLSINFKKGIDHAYCADSRAYFEYLDNVDAKKVGIPLDLYCVYSKYYKVTGTRFNAESVNTFGYEVRWIGKNKLEDFDYVLLFPPYNLKYYKPSAVKLEGIRFFSETGALIVKVVKPG